VEEVKEAVDLREGEGVPGKAEAQAREVVLTREEAWEGSEVARAEHASARIAATKSPTNKESHVSRFNAPSADEPWFENRFDSVLSWKMEHQGK
jgi:hypothetical protein